MLLELKKPTQNATVSLQTATQKTFIAQEEQRAKMDGNLTFRWYALEKEGTDRTIPRPVEFAWEDREESENRQGYYFLLVSETEDMVAPQVYITGDCHFPVYNLKVDTVYYWCVQKNGKRSEISVFRTEYTLPRNLKIDNLSNFRDMGGYKVQNGRIRQGLVYRGGEFEQHIHLSPEGVKELKRLGIRTELDMRGEVKDTVDFTTAELFGIRRVYVPCIPYEGVFDSPKRKMCKDFYKVFASVKNYPIYFHCWGGADRTGTFAFILGAFLGMSIEDLIYEYEYTSLSVWGTRSRNYEKFQAFLRQFMELSGATLQEKGRTFLQEYAGLTDKQLRVIYDMLVEK